MCDSDSDSELLANLLATAADEDDDKGVPEKPKSSNAAVSEQSKFNDEHDSDDDLLATLLGSENESNDTSQQAPTSGDNCSSLQPKTNALKELDFNFLDDVSEDVVDKTAKPPTPKKVKKLAANVAVTEENADSESDEEDKKYFEQQRYSDYGKEIKRLIKTQEAEKAESFGSELRKENSYRAPVTSKDSPKLSNSFKSKVNIGSPSLSSEKSNKYSLQASVTPKTTTSSKRDVYSDPVFGLRITKPLISSAELVERMQGRKPVTVSAVKMHLFNVAKSSEQQDWVIAGVVLNKSATRTSAKGSQYCIWKISDLSMEMNAVSVFLFSGAYKHLWKVPTGTVVGILNPSVLEHKDNSKELATLSVDNEHKVMILGISRDLGQCKSMKKNGEPCTAPVNLHHCEYCVYHVKQEYGKFSKRTDLQSHGMSNTLGQLGGAGQAKKPISIYQQRHPEAKPFVAVLAKRDEKQFKKDRERLALLKGDPKALQHSPVAQPKTEFGTSQIKTVDVEVSTKQTKRDLDRLNKLRGWNSSPLSPSQSSPSSSSSLQNDQQQRENKSEIRMMLSSPRLGTGLKNGLIDFSEPIPKSLVNKAKINAIEYVKRNGGFKKTNPNQIRPSKELMSEKGIKRKREENDSETVAEKVAKKEQAAKSRFQEMLEMKSSHTDLVESHEDEETEKYFRKQLAKERMEEKMLTTFKVPCKAVRCNVCKYVAFSSSDLCKKLQHPIKVFDAVKRFFKCGDCGNRTVSLDRIPTETCKRCAGSKWLRAAMMDEKKTQLPSAKLSIRGAEEAYIGANVSGENLDLLVPESD